MTLDGETFELEHGSVVIAAITSCTNTSNPAVMVAAGLLAKKAVERGLERKPWVKSSLAPGSKVVTEYYDKAGLTPYLEALGFHTVGYGCTTCIGNSGPLPEPISRGLAEGDLVVCAVLSGNRNFEARIHSEVKANYLASPPLVVAYALAGRMDVDLLNEPLGVGSNGEDVFLSDIWPSPEEVRETVAGSIGEEMFRKIYADVFTGDATWRDLPVPEGELFAWDPGSTYVRLPTYFEGMPTEPGAVEDVSVRAVWSPSATRHDRPHLAGRARSSPTRRRAVPDRARGRAARVQLLRLPAREPRGDGARHLRERPPPQSPRSGLGGHLDRPPPLRRRSDHLRDGRALSRGRRSPDRARGQGVRLRLVPGLGGEGAEAPRGARGHRRELRAHPPLEPADDGILPLQFLPGESLGRSV